MVLYKNTSLIVKTFYGTTFKPGETQEVKGFINDPFMVRVFAQPEEPPKEKKPAEPKKAPAKVQDDTSVTKEIKTPKEANQDGTDHNQ